MNKKKYILMFVLIITFMLISYNLFFNNSANNPNYKDNDKDNYNEDNNFISGNIVLECNYGCFENINSSVAKKIIKLNENNLNFKIIDLRTEDEYKQGHINGSMLIDYYNDNFIYNLKELDKNKTYFIYCRSGHRSGDTFRIMKQLNFKKVLNLENGINEWINQGFDIVK